ncbi:MAG: hypothetical protein O6848_04380 [Bacteroidetes bacterium]|nr:hypothetical protein [Bacteroidota bacterium]
MKKVLYATAISFFALSQLVFAQDEIVLKGDELFGNMRARHIGPALMSGRIIDLETHPTNDRVIYLGSAGGGVWKTTNGGVTFTPIFDKHAQSIGVVALDPVNPDLNIWVGTGEIWTRNSISVGDGLYKSTDGGLNWTNVGFEKSEHISSIEINPLNTSEMYVGVLGALWSDSEERGVYKSSDGGATWDQILYIGPGTGCSDVIMDPNDPNTLYASMWDFRRTGWSFSSGGPNSALYKSTDGGKSWNKIHSGFPSGDLGRIAIAVAPSNSQILYSVIESEEDKDKGLYRSDNGGASWNHLNNDFGLVVRPFYFSRITVDPKNPDVVAKAGVFGSISRDGGKTFRNLGPEHPDIHDIVFDINNSDRMYIGTDGGVYRSYDGGTSMSFVENLPLSQFYHVSVDDAEPYNVYGGLQDNGSWWGPSSSPGGVEARDWNPIGVGDGFRVLKHPTKNIIYSEMQGAINVWRYDVDRNQTKTIQPLPVAGDPKLRFNWNAPMAISKAQPDRFYMGSQFLHMSEDMGNTWLKISPDLTTNDASKQNQEESGGLSTDNSGAENHTTIFTIAESPLNEKIIWVGTDDGNVQVTRDGGSTWTNTMANIPDLPANTWCYHIEASVHAEGTAYAVFDGHSSGDMKAYAYKTTDFGASWKSIISEDVYGFVRSIQEDYEQENLLFLGTEFGLYVTIDGGANWNRFTRNMPATAVHFIELQEKSSDLVLATHGRGIIIIDDISPLRQLNQTVLQKDVHFFDSEPTIMLEESTIGGGGFGSSMTQFVGANKSKSARITYYLKKRHTFGKMAMEIQDINGNKIMDLGAGKSKGINIVTWNYVYKAPKMAAGKTLTFGGFTSPRVPAGDYKAVMIKGKNTYETIFTLQYDPSSLLTDAERVDLFDVTMKCYNMSQELAYLVYEIDEFISKAEEVSKTGSSGEKVGNPVIDELNSLKETIVITKGDNYVNSADPELREKLGDLYAKLANGFNPPSTTEMQNLQVLEDRFNKAKADYANIKNKQIAKMEKYMEKNSLTTVQLKTLDDFLSK